MSCRFVTLDVFTDAAFGGNPLAVVPDAQGIDGRRMQLIARELNLSETVFVLPPDDPANTRKVRIFTPVTELPCAGHPTVGTAFARARSRAGCHFSSCLCATSMLCDGRAWIIRPGAAHWNTLGRRKCFCLPWKASDPEPPCTLACSGLA